MDKTRIDYSKDVERYSQWRTLKAQQVGEFMKLVLAPKIKGAPEPRFHLSSQTRKARSAMIIALLVSAFVGMIVLISHAAYETVVTMIVSGIVTLVLAFRFLLKRKKDKAIYKDRRARHRAAKQTILFYEPEQIMKCFTELGEQADAIALELGVDPAELKSIHDQADAHASRATLEYYRKAVDLISQEHSLVEDAYTHDRPDPFIDAGLATTPEGAALKRDDFFGYAFELWNVESHIGYFGAQPIWYGDPAQVKLRERYRELKIVK